MVKRRCAGNATVGNMVREFKRYSSQCFGKFDRFIKNGLRKYYYNPSAQKSRKIAIVTRKMNHNRDDNGEDYESEDHDEANESTTVGSGLPAMYIKKAPKARKPVAVSEGSSKSALQTFERSFV